MGGVKGREDYNGARKARDAKFEEYGEEGHDDMTCTRRIWE